MQCEVRRAKATMSTRWLSTFQDPPLVSSPSHPSASTLYSRPLSELSFTFKKLPVTARDSLHGCVSISRLGYMFQLISLLEAYSLRNQLFCPAWHKASGSPSSLRSESWIVSSSSLFSLGDGHGIQVSPRIVLFFSSSSHTAQELIVSWNSALK